MNNTCIPSIFGEYEQSAVCIVRLAPFKTGVEIQLLSEYQQFEVLLYDNENIVKNFSTCQKYVVINGLECDKEYSVVVKSEKGESCKRIFRTGDYLGTVVNYLHPDDEYYAFSGRYIATPMIVRFKGDLYVSMDVFHGNGIGQKGRDRLTLLYRSKDDGKTWEYVAEMLPAFWGTLFVANEKLCLLAVDSETGLLLVRSSDDGETWSDPMYLSYKNDFNDYIMHKSATPYVKLNEKLYFAIEYGGYNVKRFDTLVVCLDLRKDVLDKAAWMLSDCAQVEFDWYEYSDKTIRFAIEGNMVEKDGELFILSRYSAKKALMWEYDKYNPQKAPVFHKVVDFDCGHCKFFIQKADDGMYYAMGNTECYPRQVLKLYRSENLEEWEELKILEDISMLSIEKNGVQYPNFFIEEGKFYTVLRNALNGAHSFHDSNAIVFKIYE